MNRWLTLTLGLWLGAQTGAGVAQSTDNPVVVELFTSQGCSSCPPADNLLQELAGRSDVIALALHVDYWDYLGWADEFASPAYTKRQKAYAQAVGARTVYTPQMVVQGQEHLVGLRVMELADLIAAHTAKALDLNLRLRRNGDTLVIDAPAYALSQPVTVQLVRYIPEQAVDITRGENRGRRITYVNIVTDWQILGDWDGASPMTISTKVAGDDAMVVVLQEPGPGRIVAAGRLR